MCFDEEIEAKFDNNKSILDKRLSSQSSREENTSLGYDERFENICDNKHIPIPSQLDTFKKIYVPSKQVQWSYENSF